MGEIISFIFIMSMLGIVLKHISAMRTDHDKYFFQLEERITTCIQQHNRLIKILDADNAEFRAGDLAPDTKVIVWKQARPKGSALLLRRAKPEADGNPALAPGHESQTFMPKSSAPAPPPAPAYRQTITEILHEQDGHDPIPADFDSINESLKEAAGIDEDSIDDILGEMADLQANRIRKAYRHSF